MARLTTVKFMLQAVLQCTPLPRQCT